MSYPKKQIFSALVAASFILPAGAAELTGTLKKIKESGVIVLGHRDSSIPFSFYSEDQKPIGYSWDIANLVVARIKKDLNMPNLEVRGNLVTSQTRIPLVQNGTVDLECGATTNNVERQLQVDFSVGIFQAGTRLLAKKNAGIREFSDLKGKNVVTTAGATSERYLKAMNAEKQMGMSVIAAKDVGESFMVLETGRAVAMMLDDVQLAGLITKSRNPAEWVIAGKPQSFENYGCMMRKGDTEFKKIVDAAIKDIYKSGQINKLYSKWFMSPIPPKGLNMNFPMSSELKKLIAKPTDKAADQI